MKKISKRAVTLWRIRAFIYFTILAVIAGALYGAYIYMDGFPLWPSMIAGAFSAIVMIKDVLIIPSIKYRFIRYGIIDDELRVHQGIFIRSKTHVPLFRIQNIDTNAGLLMQQLNVKSVMLRTAASIVYIPDLDNDEADYVREHIRTIVNREVGRSI